MTIAGRVQGVFFRVTCAEEARRRGLGGWVRNLPDGRVEAVFDGDDAAVEEMVAWCREGPRHADVGHVETEDEPPRGEDGFRIMR